MSSTAATASTGARVSIRVNDEPRAIAAGATIADLVRELGLGERKGVAVAINDAVVARVTWLTRVLGDGDRVLVIRATQGG
jgi:thiamine biosynthesis protein ThiS